MNKTIEISASEQAALLVLIDWFNSMYSTRKTEGDNISPEFKELQTSITNLLDKVLN